MNSAELIRHQKMSSNASLRFPTALRYRPLVSTSFPPSSSIGVGCGATGEGAEVDRLEHGKIVLGFGQQVAQDLPLGPQDSLVDRGIVHHVQGLWDRTRRS